MCHHKSGIAVNIDESHVKVYTLVQEDSHEKIRDHFNILDNLAFGRFQTPVELQPIKGLQNISDYKFSFDGDKPSWWTDRMTDQAIHQLFKASQLDFKIAKKTNVWSSNLNLSSVEELHGISLPDFINGDLNLSMLESIKNKKLPTVILGQLILSSLESLHNSKLPFVVNGDLRLPSLKSIGNKKLPAVIGGTVDLHKIRELHDVTFPEKINGSLDLFSLLSMKNVILPKSIKYNLDLNNLKSLNGIKLPDMIGHNLFLNNLKSLKGVKLPAVGEMIFYKYKRYILKNGHMFLQVSH